MTIQESQILQKVMSSNISTVNDPLLHTHALADAYFKTSNSFKKRKEDAQWRQGHMSTDAGITFMILEILFKRNMAETMISERPRSHVEKVQKLERLRVFDF